MNAAKKSENTAMVRTSMIVKSDREILITRTFDGPARIVFDAFTKPEFVKRWWAPKSHQVSIASCDADVRAGGKYRYVMRRDGGGEMAFSGEYKEVTPHSRLVYTQIFEPMAAQGAVVVTATFDQEGDRTHLMLLELYPS